MNNSTNFLQKQKAKRDKDLAQERQKILAMAPEQALSTIMDHPFPVTLIQSMADEDLFFLVHHVGPDDALPIIGLASNQQWTYLMDMEGWHRDRIASHSMTQWMQRLLKADNDRFTHWITSEKRDDFAFYLFRNIEVHIREYDQDPGEISEDFFTEDQTYYLRLRPYPKDQKPLQAKRDQFLSDLLRRISVFDYNLYRDLLLESNAIIPAEAEEELYRLRNVRLAEKGLLPLEEAVGVYQPLKPSDLASRKPKSAVANGRVVDSYPLPILMNQSQQKVNLFAQTLNKIQDQSALQQLQSEFAGLCNQIIAADQKKITEKTALNQVVQKVSDYIAIGLEAIVLNNENKTPYAEPKLILSHFLSDIFRVGYGSALSLKWKADKWLRVSWFSGQGLPLGFWGETWMGVLGGLLLKKPLFYNPVESGPLYREFATMADITRTDYILNTIIAFDDLISLMDISIKRFSVDSYLTAQNLLLTLWAGHYLEIGSVRDVCSLSMEQFKRFFSALWQADTYPRKISNKMREEFLQWLAQRSGLATYEITERMSTALEQLFLDVEQELGEVKTKDLDPRYIQLFLLRTD